MASLTFSQLFKPTVLTTLAATLYTCPATPATSLLKNGKIRATNTTGNAASWTAYAVPNGGVNGTGNCFVFQESIAANSHVDIDVPELAAGDFLQALSNTASAITVFALDGVVYSS